MRKFFQLALGMAALLVALAVASSASDLAVLRNGFSIRHERREVIGDMTRLYTGTDHTSYVDVPSSEIEHFESAPVERVLGFRAPAGAGLPASAALPTVKPVAGRPAPLDPSALNDFVNSASDRYRLDPDLVNSVIRAESGFNQHAVSPKGAQGLMQLMPATASKLGVGNAFDARSNVEGGTKYLRELLERYNFDLLKALAAYNAGPRRVEQYGGVPPYHETHAYVARIVRDFNRKKIAERKATPSPVPTNSTPKKKVVPKTAPASDRSEYLATPSLTPTKPSASQH
jgi:soluble lytic murein transglycosylase-like protein